VSQSAQILQYLECGETITPAEAYSQFGTLALHSRIAELRSHGHRIEMTMRTEGRKRWGEYWLAVPHG
jgi:hypothetical protein